MSKARWWVVGCLLLASVIVDFKFMLASVLTDALLIGLAVYFVWPAVKEDKKP